MSQTSIKLPVRPRNYRFALTPLADAMFQLLIFFMLTSSLTPYSLLTVQSAAAPQEDEAPGPAPGPAPAQSASEEAVWTLERDSIIVGGQAFALEDLETLTAALGDDLVPADVVILVRDTARVQDVATVLSGLSTANVGSVRIAEGAL